MKDIVPINMLIKRHIKHNFLDQVCFISNPIELISSKHTSGTHMNIVNAPNQRSRLLIMPFPVTKLYIASGEKNIRSIELIKTPSIAIALNPYGF